MAMDAVEPPMPAIVTRPGGVDEDGGGAGYGRDKRALSADDPAVREFSPPVRPSLLRVVLAVVFPLLVLVPVGALLAAILGMSPMRYTIGDGALVVHSGDFFSGERSIPLADVTEVRAVRPRGGRRTAGTALPGYCAGRFSYPDLGGVWQATDCGANALLVTASGALTPVLISPPDAEAFAAAIRAGTPTSITLPPPGKGRLHVLVILFGGGGIVSVVMVSALLLLGPKRMRYRVGDGALEVRTLFGRKSWSLAGAQARTYTPQKLRRMVGTAAPGYYTGRFRESGQATRVYATEVDRVVLLEGADRVLLSPEDRVGFLRALEAEGASVTHHA
jgi:hypothetical protein